ncbi:MAG: hypothetical protein CVV64_01720 [Candidatus Wallbacteria bacterium HGW-Wallbacteria-1]|jgi:ABC-type glycerol-3-phosphate transport system substrate-binding protein|uniref:ABC transporter substrate-binding protein n=1 Tax=Candidatus Wallbacteria bacterium HGW-Wallbacteria-1 TaxID=2013854 RepID=A0A2N1PUZ2_9BACT|nr:MAG: hypothetical protein CVV64_01720 [Candidatus Wallbacteria bacterium HGW-Wallbacteria-1]
MDRTDSSNTASTIEYREYTWTVNRILLIAFFALLFGMMGWTLLFDHEVEEAGKDRIIVEFWHGMGGVLGDVLHEMIGNFNKSQDRIYIKSQHMGSYAALNQKIIASVLAGNPPDMAQAFENWTAKLLSGDAVERLNPYIEKAGSDFWPDFFDAMRANVTDRNGDIWSIPFNKSQQIMYFNKDMFRAAGLDPEQPPTNWDEFIKCCDRLTRLDVNGKIMYRSEYDAYLAQGNPDIGKPLTFGTAYPVSVWTYCNYLYQYGGALVSDDYSSGQFDTDAAAEALMFTVELIDRYRVAYKTTGRQDQNDFLGEQIGIMIGSSVSRLFMEDYIAFDWGMAPIVAGKKKASVMSGTNVIVFSQADPKVKAAAWEFIEWFTTPENTAYWSVMTTYMPVRKSALSTQIMEDHLRRNAMNDAAIKQLEYTCFEPPLSAWFQCRDLLQRALEDGVIQYLKEGDRKTWTREAQKSYLKRYLVAMNTKMKELLEMEMLTTKSKNKGESN